MEERWRVFCAMELPCALRLRVAEHLNKVRATVPGVHASWSRESSLHLTLKFIGEIARGAVPEFSAAASQAVKGFKPFPLVIGGAGVFPSRRDPKVLWLRVADPQSRLQQLQARLEIECEGVGFPKESRSFHPHLTLARLRSRERARDLVRAHEELSFESVEVFVNELVVIRSQLSSAGSQYSTVSAHRLAG